MIIYKATNTINNKIYIGQTIHTLDRRRNQHERSFKYKNTKDNVFARALEKYGIENFVWEVIDRAETLEELNEKEEFWIRELNSLVDSGGGYNVKLGGSNDTQSITTRRKISEAQKGSKNHMWGKKGVLNPKSKKVINLTDNIIYESASICAEHENLNFSHICSVCRGTRATTGGKVFRYLDDDNIPTQPDTNIKPHLRKIINVTTQEKFNNCKEAVKSLNKKCPSNLSNALKQGNGVCSYGGMIWCYEHISTDFAIDTIKSKPHIHPRKSQMKRVLNETTGQEFDSLISAVKSQGVKSYSYLSTLLKNGGGECIWKNQKWKLLE